METETVSVLFSDVAGYSELTEPQLKTFLQTVLPDIAKLLDGHRDKFIELNTWGDAIVLVSRDPHFVARFALKLRDYFRNENWLNHQLPESLHCRIGLHSGAVFTGEDPLRQRSGVIGTQMNLAARIEPMTPVGQVFATDTFISLIKQNPDPKIAWDDLGVQPLAKGFGNHHLYGLRRHDEERRSFDDIIKKQGLFQEQIPKDLSSVLRNTSSEIADLKSQLETASAALEYLSDLLREVVCYNQGEFVQYNVQAAELHKHLKEVLRDSPQDLTTLHTLCDKLEVYLHENLKRISQDNFKFITKYFTGRHVVSPRVCIKANFDEDGEYKIVQLFRDAEVNYLSEYSLRRNSGFLFVKDHGKVYFDTNIPKRVAHGEYVNARINYTKARAYWRARNKRKAQELIGTSKEFKYDEKWIKCWNPPEHNDGTLGTPDELEPRSCYKSTVIIPMTLWNNVLTNEFRELINKKLRETIKDPTEISRIIFGYLCFDHVEGDYFNEDMDIHIGYIFADILSLYMVTQLMHLSQNNFSDFTSYKALCSWQ